MNANTLVMIYVTPEEAKARMVTARKAARAAKAKGDGMREFAPKDQRTAKKIAALDVLSYINDRIAISCKNALDGLKTGGATDSSEELPAPDPTREEGVTTAEANKPCVCDHAMNYVCLSCRHDAGVAVGADVDEEGG